MRQLYFLQAVAALGLFIPSHCYAQSPSEPLVGVWNSFLNQTNVIECGNSSDSQLRIEIQLQSNDGLLLNTFSEVIEAKGTKHFVLSELPPNNYGTYYVRAIPLLATGSAAIHCLTSFYRLSDSTARKPIEYAFSLSAAYPSSPGTTFGTFNSMDPSARHEPVQNWLSVVNTDSLPFSGIVRVFNQDGTVNTERQIQIQGLAPGARQDYPLGHQWGEVVGLYEVVPQNSNQHYRSFLGRYGGAAPGPYRFAFPLSSATGSCLPQTLPVSSMDPALNWVVIANTSPATLTASLSFTNSQGELLSAQPYNVEPFSQLHVLANTVIGERAVGTATVRCENSPANSAGLLFESYYYGKINENLTSLEWAYSAQSDIAESGAPIITLYNTFLGAANWQQIYHFDNQATTLNYRVFEANGTLDIVHSIALATGATVDHPIHSDVGLDAIGLAELSVAQSSTLLRSKTIRVYSMQVQGETKIGYIMNVPAFSVSDTDTGGAEGSSSSASSTVQSSSSSSTPSQSSSSSEQSASASSSVSSSASQSSAGSQSSSSEDMSSSSLSSSSSTPVETPVTGACGGATSPSVKAIAFDFFVTKDKGRWITLAATSNDIEWNSLNDGWPTRYKVFKYGNGGAAIAQWIIGSLPVHGTLYDGTRVIEEGDVIADPDELYIVPHANFTGTDTFDYCVVDSSGRSEAATVEMHVADPRSYPMPYGIPNPNFGINEEPPPDPAGWPTSEVEGFFYIDSDAACSDTLAFGHPDWPRCSIPSNASVPAGAKMVLANSVNPYPLVNSTWHRIYLTGTAENSAWLVGNEVGPNKPRITIPDGRVSSQLRIEGQHYRVSGIDLDGPVLYHRTIDADDIVLRYSRVRNNPSTGGGGTTVGLNTQGSNVLAFQVNVNDNGIVSPNLQDERDIHAFVGVAQQGFWMLDVLCSENAGDCVQLTNNNTTRDVYVGRATMHSMMENCIDVKDFDGLVVSESDCWDIRPVNYLSGSGGGAQNFYINDEGTQQRYAYILNNRSWDTSGTNYGTANTSGKVYFIGNRGFFSPIGHGLRGFAGGGERHFYFNTVVDVLDGMNFYTPGGGSSVPFSSGNYIGSINRYASYLSSAYSQAPQHDYNLYDYTATSFAWGSSTNPIQGDINEFRNETRSSVHSLINTIPAFNNAASYDFSLSEASPLRNFVLLSELDNIAPGILDLERDLGVSFIDYRGTLRNQQRLSVGAAE